MATVTGAMREERIAVIDGWLDYVKEVLQPMPPGTGGHFVEKSGDKLTVRTQTGSATFALISCTDEEVDNGAPIYPALHGELVPIGDGTWR